MQNKQELIKNISSMLTFLIREVQSSALVSPNNPSLTWLQVSALLNIYDQPDISVGDLARKIRISSSAMAQLSDRLQKSKYIVRTADEDDKRVVRLMLSEKGNKALNKYKEEQIKILSSLFSSISQKDLRNILRIQELILKKLEKGAV